jgi:flagella basal body P-ring formation protein FlgA
MKRIILFMSLLVLATIIHTETFVLLESVKVTDAIVRLNDIALMDNDTQNQIGSLPMTVSPEIGQYQTLSRAEVSSKLLGNGIQNPVFKGAEIIRILRQGVVIKSSHLQPLIKKYIQTHSSWKDGVEVKIASSKQLIVPHADTQWKITPANGQDFFGSMLFRIQGIWKNELVADAWLMAELTIVRPVAISNRQIQKNEAVSAEDIRWENRELTPFTKNALLSETGIIGKRTSRLINANTVITASLLNKNFLVQRGHSATLIASTKSIRATSKVTALANGQEGDMVKVINNDSKIIIIARVCGENLLEVIVQ